MVDEWLWRLSPKFGGYKAELNGVAGHSGYGAVHVRSANGQKEILEIGVFGAAGLSASVLGDGAFLSEISLNNGRGFAKFRSTQESVRLEEGVKIEVVQNGDVILSGTLERN